MGKLLGKADIVTLLVQPVQQKKTNKKKTKQKKQKTKKQNKTEPSQFNSSCPQL